MGTRPVKERGLYKRGREVHAYSMAYLHAKVNSISYVAVPDIYICGQAYKLPEMQFILSLRRRGERSLYKGCNN